MAATLILPAHGAVFMCADGSGDVQFQDRPCGTSTAPSANDERRKAETARASDLRTPPAGIHASWFETPAGVNHEVFCDDSSCECGSMERRFDNDRTFAVADALYMDGSWHRYQTSIEALLDAEQNGDTAASIQHRVALEEAACDIMMSQQVLRRFADKELRELRRRAQNAEDLGRDTESACDGFSEAACQDYQQLLRYRSMSLDAKALAQPRLNSSVDGVGALGSLDTLD